MERLTTELERRFRESEWLEGKIRGNLKGFEYEF